MIKDLDARYDSRISFYGKAYIEEKRGEKVLFSYHTKVARKKADKVTLGQSYDYSSTTLRHVKEFLKQETNFFIDSVKDIRKLIKNGDIKLSSRF